MYAHLFHLLTELLATVNVVASNSTVDNVTKYMRSNDLPTGVVYVALVGEHLGPTQTILTGLFAAPDVTALRHSPACKYSSGYIGKR